MRQLNFNVIPLQAGTTTNSVAVNSVNLFQISAQIAATAGAAGTLKLQASNDDSEAANFVPVNWSDIPGATIAVAGAGAYLIPNQEICYEYIRAVYTSTGAGTISVVLKALGA